MDEYLDMSANLDCMSVKWQPPTMLGVLFTKLDVGLKFAAHHDAVSEKQSSGWQLRIFGSQGYWTQRFVTERYKQPNFIEQNSPFSCIRWRNTGATRQQQPDPLDSPLTFTASHWKTSVVLLHWPPLPHRTFLNQQVLSPQPQMLKPPKSQP